MKKKDIEFIFNQYFNGEKNIFTPHVYDYTMKRFEEEIILFEKSSGEGLFEHPLIGVTTLLYNPKNSQVKRIDLSQSFSNKKDAETYIDNINKKAFEDAEKYGEIKVILV